MANRTGKMFSRGLVWSFLVSLRLDPSKFFRWFDRHTTRKMVRAEDIRRYLDLLEALNACTKTNHETEIVREFP